MSTLTTFLNLLDEFVNELIETFPNELKLKSYQSKLEALKKTNPRKVLELFMAEVGPCSSFITNKDESFILDERHDIVKTLNLKKLWTSNEVTQNTKDAIWAHMNTLYLFGMAVNNIPNDLLNSIETVAQQCADNFEQNGNSEDMLLGMQQLLTSQMANMKNN